MKKRTNWTKIAWLAVTLWVAPALTLQARDHKIEPANGGQSKLWLVGDSSLHAYSSSAHNIGVTAAIEGAGNETMLQKFTAHRVKSFDVTVPVKEMRSGKPKLDKNMQKALKAEAAPAISFHMTSYELAASTASDKAQTIRAQGTLEIAGVKKDTVLEGTLEGVDGGVRIDGSKTILMTEFGIKPPVILMIKTADRVDVHYELWLDKNGGLK